MQPARQYQITITKQTCVHSQKSFQYINHPLSGMSPCYDEIATFRQHAALCGTRGCDHTEATVCTAFGRHSSMIHAAAGQFARLKLPQDHAPTQEFRTGFKCAFSAALAAAATALPLLPTHHQAAITTLPSQATLQNKH